ncbi:uncharacterized protein LOC120839107 [Ixodes scapularis]|uniref:uncharacterized protein LOC120839107 n=1 Tax=Ixodes scapularis TaxID=6945 RepID=UPI001A9E0FB0|nr:uncharacterized protein LOC120839107 [Ixodes scapularis]
MLARKVKTYSFVWNTSKENCMPALMTLVTCTMKLKLFSPSRVLTSRTASRTLGLPLRQIAFILFPPHRNKVDGNSERHHRYDSSFYAPHIYVRPPFTLARVIMIPQS